MGRRIKFGKTWWGEKWVETLENIDDNSGRLGRGRSYANTGKVIDIKIAEGKITAKVKGSYNNYYRVTIQP